MKDNPLKSRAYAKINYFLEVREKREDNYHDIVTVFQTISLYDELTFSESSSEVIINTDHPNLKDPLDNIIFKAAEQLRKLLKIKKGAVINLKKNIPISAGLGGGSSDAAATLKGLNRLWGLNLSRNELFRYARQLGADVPFFLEGGLTVGRGMGDKLSKVGVGISSHLPMVLVAPELTVPTPWAYKTWDEEGFVSKSPGIDSFLKALYTQNLDGIIRGMHNDFEQLVLEKYPSLKTIKQMIMKNGALGCLMTGSGPAIFGIFPDEISADKAIQNLKKVGRTEKVYAH